MKPRGGAGTRTVWRRPADAALDTVAFTLHATCVLTDPASPARPFPKTYRAGCSPNIKVCCPVRPARAAPGRASDARQSQERAMRLDATACIIETSRPRNGGTVVSDPSSLSPHPISAPLHNPAPSGRRVSLCPDIPVCGRRNERARDVRRPHLLPQLFTSH